MRVARLPGFAENAGIINRSFRTGDRLSTYVNARRKIRSILVIPGFRWCAAWVLKSGWFQEFPSKE